MALTIAIEGLGTLATAETGETFNGSAPSWNLSGSGGVSAAQDTEIYYQGAASYSAQISSGKNGWLYWESSTVYNFTASGNAEGQRIYIWFNCTTPGKMNTKATPGLAVRVGSSATAFRTFTIAGSDDLSNYSGGWRCVVIDPTLPGSIADGSGYNANNITRIGIYYNGASASRSNNVFLDSIAIGTGIRASGTETTTGEALKETVDYCTDQANRAWGALQQREGIYYAYGKLYIGSTARNTVFGTKNRVLKWGDSKYWYSSAWTTSMGNSINGLIVTDHASYTTAFTDGVLVGSDAGRSGNVYIGSTGINTTINLYGGNNAASTTYLYGTVLQGITNGITMGNDADHRYYGVTFGGCGQIDPVGAPIMRNCIFTETTSATSALKWNANIDVQKSKFIANTTGAGIQHTSATGKTYTDLTFSGNTYDVNNTSGSGMTVTKSGTSNPSTYTGSAVSFQSSLSIKVTAQDKNTKPLVNVQTAVYKISDRTELMNEDTHTVNDGSLTVGVKYTIVSVGTSDFTTVGASSNTVGVAFTATGVSGGGNGTVTDGVADATYVGATPVEVEIRCRKASSGTTKYKNFSTLATLTGDFELLVTLTEDAINNADS